jgi:hypothetical protein|tara:strand:- start:5036 stop:5545 length:510 start_codon:yes stop_codon:yes gene_type:complete
MESELLDTNWINEFEEEDKDYSMFYKETVNDILACFIYINNTNTITFINKTPVKINEGIFKKSELIQLLKNNLYHEKKKYTPTSIFKWNLDISPEEITNYIKEDTKYTFFTHIKEINDISFTDTIPFFCNENILYFIMHEDCSALKNRTKKIYINKEKLKQRKTRNKRT